MGAVVSALKGTDLATGIDLNKLYRLNTYWDQARGLYAPFESSLKSGSSDVFLHEMPGGQYTNLKFQALSLGLADQWDQVRPTPSAQRAKAQRLATQAVSQGALPPLSLGACRPLSLCIPGAPSRRCYAGQAILRRRQSRARRHCQGAGLFTRALSHRRMS